MADISLSNQKAKNNRIDAEWAALIPKGWGTFGGEENMHAGERKMLYDFLEDDKHLEALVGGHFGPDDLTPLIVSEASRVQLRLQHTPLATCLSTSCGV